MHDFNVFCCLLSFVVVGVCVLEIHIKYRETDSRNKIDTQTADKKKFCSLMFLFCETQREQRNIISISYFIRNFSKIMMQS
jgi:hypothetical protein